MDLLIREIELKKRLAYPYKWGTKQNDEMDRKTNFIYHTFFFNDLLKKIEYEFKYHPEHDAYFNYAINRWFTFWSAMAVERIFCSFDFVHHAMEKDRLVDFTIKGIRFDHKTAIFPKNFPHSYEHAKNNKRILIEWLYLNQSQQQRKHLKNRLFLVLYDKSGGHWKLRAEIAEMKKKITGYLNTFDETKLEKFQFEKEEITLSDIIFIEKED